jgi:hypothetical protein
VKSDARIVLLSAPGATVLSGVLVLLVAALAPGTARAVQPRPGFVVQGFLGAAINFDTDLTISQTGQDDISLRASWETRPFDQPLYWMLRLRWQRERDGFELQLLHHKIYLENTRPDVEHFEVTHGFNILTANYLKRGGLAQFRLGAGMTITHAESTVRGEHHTSAHYTIGGPAFLVGVGGEYGITDRLFLAGDIQFVAAWATVDVHEGEASVTSLAFHLMLGLGYVF